MTSKDKRDDVQERFFRNELPIVIATKGFGMGLDKRDIRFIYHYNIPSSPEEYVQQTGRAGRDSNPSFCEVLYSTDDVDKMRKILSRGCDENFKMNIRSFVSELKNGGYEINITQSARNLKMTESTIQSILLYLERIGIVNYESVNYRNYEIRILTHKKENLSEDERSFLNYLMASAQTFTGWSSINIYRESENLHKEPSDILRMLNALNDKGIIDLRMQQVLESYTLNKSNFDIDQVAEDIFTIFKERSDQAIKRFNVLESILTSGICIKSQLNRYFGNKTNGHCGSCSVCTVLNPLSRISFQIPLTSLIRYQNLKGQSLLS